LRVKAEVSDADLSSSVGPTALPKRFDVDKKRDDGEAILAMEVSVLRADIPKDAITMACVDRL
jgi:hypothetical protein